MRAWFAYLRQGLARTLPEDRIAGGEKYSGAKANLNNLRPFLVRHWRQAAFGASLILFGSLLGFPEPLIYRFLVDHVILGRELGLLAAVVLLMAAVKGLSLLSGSLQSFFFTRIEQAILLDLQHDLLDRTLRLPKAFFDAKETGYLMSRLLSDVQGLRWFFSGTLISIVGSVLSLIGGVVFLFYLEWRLATITLVLLPALVLLVRYFAAKSRILSHHGMEQQAQVTRTMEESLSATLLVKSFASEKRTVARVMEQLEAARELALEQMTVGSLFGLAVGVLRYVGHALVLAAGAFWVIRGEWSLGSLLAFQSYLGYVEGPALFLASANLQLQNALAALERVSVLFEIVPEENLGSGRKVAWLRGEVEFKGVSFSYDGREPVVENVSFRVSPGEHVAIVGPSGVGKTTLLSLLLRFYKPTSGEIWFDGCSASDYDLVSLRERIGYVAQSPQLLSGTLLENLRYGNPDATEAEVIEAARVAGIHDFIASLPEGYHAPVGEKGVNLSEGQKQRLALARALVKHPDILVLDEPTSALDSLVERSIFEALPTLLRDKTLFVVAHRLATIRNADRILLLNDKRLVAVGKHAELLETNTFYRSLVASQALAT